MVLRAGVPTNDPFSWTPPDMVYRESKSIKNGIYSKRPTYNNSYTVICKPCVQCEGIISNRAQNKEILPKL